ncbi:MAG: glycosyltransferase family 1 protein [Acidobacteriota bacterium]
MDLRIGFDARAAFLDPRRGFGRVTRALAEALLRLAPGRLTLYVPHRAHVPLPWYPLAARVVPLRRPRRGAFLCDPLAWRFTLARYPVDVLHLPAWGVPPGLRLPVVATFHDATPLHFPSPPGQWSRYRLILAIRSLTRATLVHAVSRHAGQECREATGIPEERIRVVLHGVEERFRAAAVARPPRHLLFVGSAEPHKNLGLLLAMLALPGAERLPALAIVGAVSEAALPAQLRAGDRITLVSACSDETLIELYRGALALLIPSRNEGFGLPALEAMACGCPVFAARAGALGEVCGEAGRLLSPDDPTAWRDALLALSENPSQRELLAQAGAARARELTWDRAAVAMLEVYREAAAAFGARG